MPYTTADNIGDGNHPVRGETAYMLFCTDVCGRA